MKKYNDLSEGEKVCVQVCFEQDNKKYPYNVSNRALTNVNPPVCENSKYKMMGIEPSFNNVIKKEAEDVINYFDNLHKEFLGRCK